MLLGGVHVVDVVEAVGVPHGEVRVHLDVASAFPLVDLSSEVLHHGDRSVVRPHLHDWTEKVVAVLLTLQRWAQSDHHFEVVLIRSSLARLKGI